MTENEISGNIIDVAYRAHSLLGPGLLESVYEAVLAIELDKRDWLSFGSSQSQSSTREP